MFTQFKETYNSICAAIGYVRPLSYEEWIQLPDEYKAGAIYVQFFDQICLAYSKVKTNAAIEEECVSEVLAYIMKNVYGCSVSKLNSANLKEAKKAVSENNVRKLKNGWLVTVSDTRARKNKLGNTYYLPMYKIRVCKGNVVKECQIFLNKDENGNEILPNFTDLSFDDLMKFVSDSNKLVLKFDSSKTKINKKNFTPSYFYTMAKNCLYCKSIDYVAIPTSWFNTTVSNITSTADGDELDLFDTVSKSHDFDDDMMSDKMWSLIENTDIPTKTVIHCLLSGEKIPKKYASKYDEIISSLQSQLAEFKDYFLG